jgi:hypothetical protein
VALLAVVSLGAAFLLGGLGSLGLLASAGRGDAGPAVYYYSTPAFLLLSVLLIATGYGLLGGRTWSRTLCSWLAAVIAVADAAFWIYYPAGGWDDAFDAFVNLALMTSVLLPCIATVWYLQRPRVKAYFASQPKA